MKAPLLISESAIKIHYGPFRFLYLVFSLLPPPLSLLSFFISSLFNAYFFDTYLEAEGNEATLKAKLFLDMIFFKLFAFVFRSIKIKLAEIFIIKRLTLFIYFFFSKHFISKTLSSTPLLTFASRESSLFPSIREPVTIAPEIRALQKQAFLGAWTLFPLGCRKLRRRTREVDRTADINKNSLTWVNHHLYPMEKASNEDKSKRTYPRNQNQNRRKERSVEKFRGTINLSQL